MQVRKNKEVKIKLECYLFALDFKFENIATSLKWLFSNLERHVSMSKTFPQINQNDVTKAINKTFAIHGKRGMYSKFLFSLYAINNFFGVAH